MTDKIAEAKQLAELGYSLKAIELYQNKLNVGVMENSDAGAVFLGICGDLVRLYIKLREGVVSDAKFLCYGCPGSSSAMSALTILISGKTLSQAKLLTINDILDVLGGLPENKQECAELAIRTLSKVIAEYEKSKVLV
jgi:nitrogen fixation NifU-like protein